MPSKLATAGVAVGVVVSGLASTALGVLVHLDAPVTRRVVQQSVNALFDDLFAGSVRLGAITSLAAGGIEVASFVADTPSGSRVIEAERVRIGGGWLPSLLDVAFAGGDATLTISHVRIERASVGIVMRDGHITIAEPFAARDRTPSPPGERGAKSKFGLRIERIEVGEVRGAGELAPSLPLDATVSRLLATFELDADGIALDVERTSVRDEVLLGAATIGSGDFHLRVALGDDAPAAVALAGSFAGSVGTLQISADARIAGDDVHVSVDVPRVGPEELAPWIPTRPIQRAVAARATLSGTLPLLRLDGEVLVPAIAGASAGTIALNGHLHAGERVVVVARVGVDSFDLRLLGGDLPASDINANLLVHGRLDGAASEIHAGVISAASTVAGEEVPPIEGIAMVSRDGVIANLLVREDGSPIDAEVSVTPDGRVRFAVAGEVAALERSPRIAAAGRALGALRGRARALAEGSFEAGRLDVVARAEVDAVRVPGAKLAVGAAHVRARVHGPLDALSVDAQLRGDAVSVAEQRFTSVTLNAHGPIASPAFSAEAHDADARAVRASGRVDARAGVVRDVRVAVQRGDDTIEGEVSLVDSRGGVKVDGITLRGLGGKVDGALDVRAGRLSGKLVGSGIELGPLSRLLGLPYRLRGKADMDIDISQDRDGRHGHASLRLDDVGVLLFGGADIELDAIFEGDRIRPLGKVSLSNPALDDGEDDPCAGVYAAIGVKGGELFVPGALLDAASWREASGVIKLSLQEWKLACLAELVRPLGVLRNIARVEGVADGEVTLAVGSGQPLPNVEHFELATRDLVVGAVDDDGAPSWLSDAIDVDLGGTFDSVDGEASASVGVRERGKLRPLVALAGSAKLDLAAIRQGGERRRSAIETMPISARLTMGRTSLARIAKAAPKPLGDPLGGVAGDVDVDVFVEGSLRDPAATFRARAWNVAPAEVDEGWDLPDAVDVIATYHRGVGRLDGKIQRRGRNLATVAGESKGNVSARLLGGDDPRWTGWLEAKLDRVPLQTVPQIARAKIAGAVSGEVSVHGLGDNPEVKVDLHAPEVTVGGLRVVRPRLNVTPAEGNESLVVKVSLPLKGGGGLELDGFGSLSWEDRLYPAPDGSRPATLNVSADRFPLAVLKPALGDSVSRVGGTLNGWARATYKHVGEGDLDFDADLRLSDGMVHLPGQQIHDVGARIHTTPGLVRIDEISASVDQGRATGWLLARVDGTNLRDLTGTITVAENEPVPLAVDGVPIGSASGGLMINMTRGRGQDARTNLVVSSANIKLQLPPSAAKDVQALEAHPDVRLSHPLDPPKIELGEIDNRFDVTLALAGAEVSGNQLRIVFGTNLDNPIQIRGGGDMRGELTLTSGELFVLDKNFRIERGIVRFGDEPGNPYVNLTAYWTAPDGSTVFVDYVGLVKPISRDKISFRSNPARGEAEILSLLLLGDSDSDTSAADATSGGNERATSLGSGLAASQFNAILGQVAPGVSTKFGASDGHLSTTVAYQVNDSVTLSATYEVADSGGAVEEQGATQSGGANASERRSVSVDWRFAESWLVRGTFGVGDGATSGVDLLFHHRY